MSYILLRDKNRCPRCVARIKLTDNQSRCRNCSMRLFIRPIDFQAFEDDGNPRIYWLWHNEHGWIHRDHVMLGLKAQQADEKIEQAERNTNKVISHDI